MDLAYRFLINYFFICLCGASLDFNHDIHVKSDKTGDEVKLKSTGQLTHILDLDDTTVVKRVKCKDNLLKIAFKNEIDINSWQLGDLIIGSAKWGCKFNSLNSHIMGTYAKISSLKKVGDHRLDVHLSSAGPLDAFHNAKIELHYMPQRIKNTQSHRQKRRAPTNILSTVLDSVNWRTNYTAHIPLLPTDNTMLLYKSPENKYADIRTGLTHEEISKISGHSDFYILCKSCDGHMKLSFHLILHIKTVNKKPQIVKFLSQIDSETNLQYNISAGSSREITLTYQQLLWQTGSTKLAQIELAIFKKLPPIELNLDYIMRTYIGVKVVSFGPSIFHTQMETNGNYVVSETMTSNDLARQETMPYNWTIKSEKERFNCNSSFDGRITFKHQLELNMSIGWSYKDIILVTNPPAISELQTTIILKGTADEYTHYEESSVNVFKTFTRHENWFNFDAFGLKIRNIMLSRKFESMKHCITSQLTKHTKANCFLPGNDEISSIEDECGPSIIKIIRGDPDFQKLEQVFGDFILFASEEFEESSWCGDIFRSCVSCINQTIGDDDDTKCADRMMIPALALQLTRLAKFIHSEWPKRKLVVKEAWDEPTSKYPKGKYGNESVFYEGRAARIGITKELADGIYDLVYENNSSILQRLIGLAACSGFPRIVKEDESGDINLCIDNRPKSVNRKRRSSGNQKEINLINERLKFDKILFDLEIKIPNITDADLIKYALEPGQSYPSGKLPEEACGPLYYKVTPESLHKINKQVFQQIVRIPMGTNCTPLLADLFLYSYGADVLQNLVKSNKKTVTKNFNFTYRYIDDILSINNPNFSDSLEIICPNELAFIRVLAAKGESRRSCGSETRECMSECEYRESDEPRDWCRSRTMIAGVAKRLQNVITFVKDFTGKKDTRREIVFLLDDSMSTSLLFNIFKFVVADFVTLYGKHLEIGVATFSETYKTIVSRKRFVVSENILSMHSRNGKLSKLADALGNVKLKFSARSDAERLLVLITDGMSNDHNEARIKAAELQSSNISIAVVASGPYIDDVFLKEIVSSDDLYMELFESQSISQNIVSTVFGNNNTYNGEIVFLVKDSESMKYVFDIFKYFLEDFFALYEHRFSKIVVKTFSDKTVSVVVKTFNGKIVLDRSQLTPSLGSVTHMVSALSGVMSSGFSSAQNTKLLVLMTDGLSNDQDTMVEAEINRLKSKGVKISSIAVGSHLHTTLLKNITDQKLFKILFTSRKVGSKIYNAVATSIQLKVQQPSGASLNEDMRGLRFHVPATSGIEPTTLAAIAIKCGFHCVTHNKDSSVDGFIKVMDGFYSQMESFPKVNLHNIQPPIDEELEYSYPSELETESKKPLLFNGFDANLQLSDNYKVKDFLSSGKRVFRLDPFIVECLELINADLNDKVLLVTGHSYRTRSDNMENIDERHLQEKYRYQMGQAIAIKPSSSGKSGLFDIGKSLTRSCTPVLRLQRRSIGIGCHTNVIYFDIRPSQGDEADSVIELWNVDNIDLYENMTEFKTMLTIGGPPIIANNLKKACKEPKLGEDLYFLSLAISSVSLCSEVENSVCTATKSKREQISKNLLNELLSISSISKSELEPHLWSCFVHNCGGCIGGGNIWIAKIKACSAFVHKYLDSLPNTNDLRNKATFFNTDNSNSSVHSIACHDGYTCIENSQLHSLLLSVVNNKYNPDPTLSSEELVYSPNDNPLPVLDIVEQEMAFRSSGTVRVFIEHKRDISALLGVLKILMVYNRKVERVEFHLTETVNNDVVATVIQRKIETWAGVVCPLRSRLVITPFNVASISHARRKRSIERSSDRNKAKTELKNWEIDWILNT